MFNSQARGYAVEHEVDFRDISKWELDEIQLAYWQLELYTHLANMPLGFILLLSRLHSGLRDNKVADINDVATRLKQLAEETASIALLLESGQELDDRKRVDLLQRLFDKAGPRATKSS